jgi:exonuclease SbcC
LKNEENEELVHIRRQLVDLQLKIKNLDNERLIVATEQGRRQSNVEKLRREQQRFVELQAKLKIHDLVANALSRRGVPNMIVSSQLPLINAEIARILHGIVDFTVELQGDVESNAMDIFINYGDSRRIIELASGMEKTLGSIAIRVALRSVSSLPKTNMLIIDEGFGTLDDASVEACNRLLVSLKRTFKNVVVITHVDGIKDIADNIVEITRVENDSRVTHK